MAHIRAFEGYRFDTQGTDISELCSPPYDVLSEEERSALVRKNPHNNVELELAEGALDLKTPANRYETAKNTWDNWRNEGIVSREKTPSLYVLMQDFDVEGEMHHRVSVICEVELARFEEKIILPHERTLPKALGDRYRLTETTKANFSQVFGLYSDNTDDYRDFITKATSAPETAVATDDDGVVSHLWVENDPVQVRNFAGLMAEKQVFIADGHHRYTVALSYRDAYREQRYGTKEPESLPDFDAEAGPEYVMMALSNMDDPQLVVLPYHRASKADEDFDTAGFESFLAEHFDISDDLHVLETSEAPAFAFKTARAPYKAAVLRGDADELIGLDHCSAWKHLDVSVLQELVIARFFGITPDDASSLARMSFSKNLPDLEDKLEDGSVDVVFSMRATKMSELKEVSLSGETMPQKSTYFYPKLPSGMVYRSMDID